MSAAAKAEAASELASLRAENATLRGLAEEHRILLVAFTDPTDRTPPAVGLLNFVSRQIEIEGWARNPNEDGNTDTMVATERGHDSVRHFRFLASLIDLAASWCTGAAK